MLTSHVHHYRYPINANSPDWHDYTVQEKVEMLRIPQTTLERMTNAALVRAIYEFPYVADYMLYDSAAEEGIMVMLSYFSAPEELKSRQLSPEALLSLAAPYEFMLRNIPDNEYSEVRIRIISTLDILNVLAGGTAKYGLFADK